MKRWSDSFGFATLLSILLPGAGHAFWHDYLFGIFVFLIALLAVALVFFSILIPLPAVVKLVLFTLPALFYVASFVDLYKTVQKKGRVSKRSRRTVWMFLAVAVVVQFFAPFAPGRVAVLNRPSIQRISHNDLAPMLRRGDWALCSQASYRVELPIWDRPIRLRWPDCGDVVSFADNDAHRRMGLVLAGSRQYAEVVDGTLWVNGELQTDAVPDGLHLSGDMPLTAAETGSILVATLKLGVIDSTYQVPSERLLGRVYRLF